MTSIYTHEAPTKGDLDFGRKAAKALRKSIPLEGNEARLRKLRENPCTLGDMRAHLAASKVRVSCMNLSPTQVSAYNQWADSAMASLEDGENVEKMNEIRARAAKGDEEARAICDASIKEVTSMLLVPFATWIGFMTTVTLADDEYPVIRHSVEQETSVRVISQDGSARDFGAVQNVRHQFADLFTISTDWFVYSTSDIYHGSSVKNAALAVFDMARDLALHIDSLIRSYCLVGAPGSVARAAFTTTGALSDRDYLVHSTVATGNLPTGNIIALTDNSPNTKPRKAMLKAIIDYCERFGSGTFANGESLVPVAVHVPSSHASALLDEMEVEANTNEMREEIRKDFKSISYGGYTFTIVSDPTLDDAGKHAYVRMNRPVGVFYTKPSQDQVLTDSDVALKLQHKERKIENKVIGMAFPKSWSVNFLAVKYRS